MVCKDAGTGPVVCRDAGSSTATNPGNEQQLSTHLPQDPGRHWHRGGASGPRRPAVWKDVGTGTFDCKVAAPGTATHKDDNKQNTTLRHEDV